MGGDLDRAHERIDAELKARGELEREVTALATEMRVLVQTVNRLSNSVDVAMHKTPCRDLCELQRSHDRHIKNHDDTAKNTVRIERENKRDWRMIALRWLERLVIAGAALGWMKLSEVIEAAKDAGAHP